MKFGETSGRIEIEFNPFTDEFILEILQAVAKAWGRMRHPESGEFEDRITFRLAGRLLHDPFFRDLPYDIVPQYWLLGMDGQRLGRLDLRFKHRNSHRDYFAFESKRLHVRYPGGSDSPEYSVYTGGEGMGAFISGQYSVNLLAAGMLGYVMDANTTKAWNGLVTSIHSRREVLRLPPSSQLVESQFKAQIQACLPGICLGETEHALVSRALRLFHLLLPVGAASDFALSRRPKGQAPPP
jgi:hypothetical protein